MDAVELQDTSPHGVVILAPDSLTPGQSVIFRHDALETKANVTHCEKRGNEFLIALRFILHERRREDRLSTAGFGTLCWFERGSALTAVVQVKNAGDNGAQLEMDQSLSIDQMVRLCGERWECLGRVRHCQGEGSNYVVGLEFSMPPYPTKSLDFRD